jgi:mono/diheme cytochrome c family protein
MGYHTVQVSRAIVGLIGVALVGAECLQLRAAAAQATPPGTSPQRALVDTYCVTCHNERLKTANLFLDKMDVEHVGTDQEAWEKIVRKLRAGTMPPVGRPRPDQATADGFIAWLETALDRAAAVQPNPGRPTIHRLNRTEYANAVRDLLSLEVDARALLPADDTDEHGFDNSADVLSLSPALLERYLAASEEISRLAVGRRSRPVVETYNVPRMLDQSSRLSDDLPFGSRGGTAVRHYFPVNGEYLVKVRLQKNLYDYIRGLGEPNTIEVRLDGERLKTFVIGGVEEVKPPPPSFAGAIRGNSEWEVYAHQADANLDVRFKAKAGTRSVAVSFVRKSWEPEGVPQPAQVGYPLAVNEMFDGLPAIESIAVGGPFEVDGPGETPTRSKIFTCRPRSVEDEESCAGKILSTLARRAYRRSLTPADVQTLVGFYQTGRREGSFDAGIEFALERILIDPDFLFRIERDPEDAAPGTVHRLSDVELASRLSFFLWSSIPDDELLDVAIRGKLKDPATLDRQVRRMLADPRSTALVDNFADQWLIVSHLRNVTPDPDLFPDFDENLRQAFQRETELFVESQLREDRSVPELLTADYTFVNERLARHYRIPNVYGSRFRRVSFADGQRGGLLGQGSILTVTSYPNRTSPVLRGKWLLENILGTPPPPPPPDVPALKDKGEDGSLQSVRQRLESHRKNPACASCHAQMDPLGFALENFDAVGTWRTHESGKPLDASGVLQGGTEFQGMAGLRTLLGARRQQFVGTVTEKLLSYALGRGVEYYDLPAIRKITRDAASADYRWSSIIVGIVKSTPFQMRRSES